MLESHHIESAKTYLVGGSAMTSPLWLTALTPTVQFLAALAGLIIVVLRGYYDYREHKKKNKG